MLVPMKKVKRMRHLKFKLANVIFVSLEKVLGPDDNVQIT